MPQHLMALAIGFALDLVVGDPHWLPHPIRLIGHLISGLERILRRAFPATPRGERIAGGVLVVLVCAISTACAIALLVLCGMVSPWLALAVESVMCYQMLATKALRDESMKVHDALAAGNLAAARTAVSMIVGRDVERLDEAGVTRAAVETVAENASDGVVAPLLFMAVGGAPLGVFYKAVNTMDSMVGYKNEKYRYFGTAAARFDDVLNFVPARLAGVLMVCAASLARLDAKGAWRIFLRDRRKHASPTRLIPRRPARGRSTSRSRGMPGTSASSWKSRRSETRSAPSSRQTSCAPTACCTRRRRLRSCCALP